MRYLPILLIGLLGLSMTCPKHKLKKSIIGTWVHDSYSENSAIFISSDSLKRDAPGIEFKKDGTLIKRQNDGWCGTPPITYSNQDGTWKIISDTSIQITYSYWRGQVEEDLWIQPSEKGILKYETIESRTIKNQPVNKQN